MSNETCTVSIADIYGAEWWERNKAELDREWEWEFGMPQSASLVAPNFAFGLVAQNTDTMRAPRIILHRRKPKPPTLREVYGTDEVKIPQGWEWTGEWRITTTPEANGNLYVRVPESRFERGYDFPFHRLILRERPKRVWFKAEEKARCPKAGDYIWTSHRDWAQAEASLGIYLCATRHEEVDDTVQVVTQADVDKAVGR